MRDLFRQVCLCMLLFGFFSAAGHAQVLQPFLSSGKSDAGVQLSLQKFFDRQAFYLTGSAVCFSGSDNPVTPDLEEIVPSVVLADVGLTFSLARVVFGN